MDDAPIEYSDLKVFDAAMTSSAADAMIATVWSRVRKLAPCLKDPEFVLDDDDLETIKSTMRAVILRWSESGSGMIGSRTAGDYAETYVGVGGGKFQPDEIRELQSICSSFRGTQAAYSVNPTPAASSVIQHAAWCNINFGETILCDCGAELTANGQPLWHR